MTDRSPRKYICHVDVETWADDVDEAERAVRAWIAASPKWIAITEVVGDD